MFSEDFDLALQIGLHRFSYAEIKAQDLGMADEALRLAGELVEIEPDRWLIEERERPEIGLCQFRLRDGRNQLSFGRTFRAEAGREQDCAIEVAVWIDQR